MTNFIGIFAVTAYCATGNPCSDGSVPKVNSTCAVSRDLWKEYRHKKIFIDGIGERIVTDKMAARWRNRMDLFMGSRREAFDFGKHTNRVWVVK
jgi:3D (Asp-Asp-Asp) domain-containing protein